MKGDREDESSGHPTRPDTPPIVSSGSPTRPDTPPIVSSGGISSTITWLNALQEPYPTTNVGMQNGRSVGTCTHCVHVFARLGADLHAQSVLIDKISASELTRTFIGSALLVGYNFSSHMHETLIEHATSIHP